MKTHRTILALVVWFFFAIGMLVFFGFVAFRIFFFPVYVQTDLLSPAIQHGEGLVMRRWVDKIKVGDVVVFGETQNLRIGIVEKVTDSKIDVRVGDEDHPVIEIRSESISGMYSPIVTKWWRGAVSLFIADNT